ncbi:MAG: hypothetical protein PWP23_1061 [Candidatus Sumerlaeota bacterium]|nr:hypothetical protein [Candidatus Sumerlaeota bacterium]
MRRTALWLAVILAVIAVGMFTFLTRSIRSQKVNQKLEKGLGDLMGARAALEDYAKATGLPFAPAEDGSLPPEYVEHFAAMRGGQPYYRELGRYSRLDVFSPGKPYKEPLAYFVRESIWLLVSRGPDGAFQVPPTILNDETEQADLVDRLLTLSYDPTNGAESSGDLWMSNAIK